MQVAAIVLVHGAVATAGAAPLLSDEQVDRLGLALARLGGTATAGRLPPDIWTWEPLLDEGVVSLEGLLAVAEVDLQDTPAARSALRQGVSAWLAGLAFRRSLHVTLGWATQKIQFTKETLASRVSDARQHHGHQDQG